MKRKIYKLSKLKIRYRKRFLKCFIPKYFYKRKIKKELRTFCFFIFSTVFLHKLHNYADKKEFM